MTSTPYASPRGTRPRDRRARILEAATTLFYERGYEQTSIADVAASVNVAPSALYRHYRGKATLLHAAVEGMIEGFGDLVDDLPALDLDGIAATCARTALEHRPLGVLWQRESRNLPAGQRDELRTRLRAAVGTLGDTLRRVRPELDEAEAAFLASCAVNAMASISFHRDDVADHEQHLTALARRIVGHGFGPDPEVPPPAPAPTPPLGRREQIAEAAVPLLARLGFDAMSIDDLGAAVGLAGPSLYNHVGSKQEVLLTVLERAYQMLLTATAGTGGEPPAVALRRLTDAFVAVACDHPDLLTTMIAETRNLGPGYDERASSARQDFLGAWVALLHAVHPDDHEARQRITAQAVQVAAAETGRSGFARVRPRFRGDLAAICRSLQDV